MKLKNWTHTILFILGGALLGLGYSFLVGCSTGGCPITSSPVASMIYMGMVGWLISCVFGKGCSDNCSM